MTFYVTLGLKYLYYGTAYQFSLISILFYVFGRCVLLHLEISVFFHNGVFMSNWLNHNIIFGNYYSKCFWRYLESFNIYFFPEILMVEVEVRGKNVNPWERWGVLWNPVLSSNTHNHEPPSFKYLEIPTDTCQPAYASLKPTLKVLTRPHTWRVLIVDAFWGKESHFSLQVWLLRGSTFSSGYAGIFSCKDTLTDSSKLKLINAQKLRKVGKKFGGGVMGILEGFTQRSKEWIKPMYIFYM